MISSFPSLFAVCFEASLELTRRKSTFGPHSDFEIMREQSVDSAKDDLKGRRDVMWKSYDADRRRRSHGQETSSSRPEPKGQKAAIGEIEKYF